MLECARLPENRASGVARGQTMGVELGPSGWGSRRYQNPYPAEPGGAQAGRGCLSAVRGIMGSGPAGRRRARTLHNR